MPWTRWQTAGTLAKCPSQYFSSLNLSQHILLSRLRQISLLNTSLLNSQYREYIDIHSTQLSPLRLRERWVWFGLVEGSGEHNLGHTCPMHLPSGVQCTPLLLIKASAHQTPATSTLLNRGCPQSRKKNQETGRRQFKCPAAQKGRTDILTPCTPAFPQGSGRGGHPNLHTHTPQGSLERGVTALWRGTGKTKASDLSCPVSNPPSGSCHEWLWSICTWERTKQEMKGLSLIQI